MSQSFLFSSPDAPITPQVYLLKDAEGVVLARAAWCFGLDGDQPVLSRGRPADLLVLEGVSAPEPERLRGALTITLETTEGHAALRWWLADAHLIAHHPTTLTLAGTLEPPAYDAQTHALCRQWCVAWPQARNRWAGQPTPVKRAWISAALHMRPPALEAPPAGGVYTLDGRHVTDHPSLFLALGEAFRGPGGYAGRCLDGLADCFCGGFGMRAPCTLRWNHPHIARAHLTADAWRHERLARCQPDEDVAALRDAMVGAPPLWEVVLEVLGEAGVDVVLEVP